MGERLKPCPFCGGFAKIVTTIVPDGNMHYEEGYVICARCVVRTSGSVLDGYYGCKGSIEDEIKKWNARANE